MGAEGLRNLPHLGDEGLHLHSLRNVYHQHLTEQWNPISNQQACLRLSVHRYLVIKPERRPTLGPLVLISWDETRRRLL